MTRRATRSASFLARARREHRVLLRRLQRIERALTRPSSPARARTRRAAVARLLDTCERQIAPHLTTEEVTVYPRLHARLPEETGTLDAALREHDTLRNLIGLLRLRSDRFTHGEPGAEVDIEVALHDLVQLWAIHVRRVDDVVGPLLSELPRGDRHD